MLNKIKKTAFTLAEVLITLSIIGVIAALTIPVLINAIEKQQLVEQYKTTYSILSNAVQKLKVDYGSIEAVASMSKTVDVNFMEAFQTELKFAKICDTGAGGGICFHDGTTNYKNLHGDNGPYSYNTLSSAILPNGAMIVLGGAVSAKTCNGNTSSITSGPLYNSICLFVTVDVNGFKKPNVLGRDIFMLWITKESLYPRGSNGDYNYSTSGMCNVATDHAWSGQSCGARVLTENAMNY